MAADAEADLAAMSGPSPQTTKQSQNKETKDEAKPQIAQEKTQSKYEQAQQKAIVHSYSKALMQLQFPQLPAKVYERTNESANALCCLSISFIWFMHFMRVVV